MMWSKRVEAAVLALALLLVAYPVSAEPQAAEDVPQTTSDTEAGKTLPFSSAFDQVRETYGEQLGALHADGDALSLFTSELGRALKLDEAVGILKVGPRAVASQPAATLQDVQRSAIRLTAMLALWHATEQVRRDPVGSAQAFDDQANASRQAQDAWFVSQGVTDLPFRRLADALHWASALPRAEHEPESYEAYRMALERAYPDVVGTDDAWIPVVEREGAAVLRQRLMDKQPGEPVSEPVLGHLAARYLDQRLRPLLEAYLVAGMAKVQQRASLEAYEQWMRLYGLRDRLRSSAGMTRLCGTWQWSVHNHRNHGDLKSTMMFAPPGETPPGVYRPHEIVALGDMVYLRWELPGGVVQEDSLLFTAEGKRLEGSFVNSSGSWGNITGRRLRGCTGAPEAPDTGDSGRERRPRSRR